MNRGDYKFVDLLPSYIIADDHEEGIDEESVAGWIIHRLWATYESEFVKTTTKLGYSLQSVKMEVDTAKTMWTESNINNRQQRIILRYIRSVFGKKCLIPSTERKGLQEMRNRANYFSPISNLGEIVMDEEEIHYWTKKY